jgi:hypothetical protein
MKKIEIEERLPTHLKAFYKLVMSTALRDGDVIQVTYKGVPGTRRPVFLFKEMGIDDFNLKADGVFTEVTITGEGVLFSRERGLLSELKDAPELEDAPEWEYIVVHDTDTGAYNLGTRAEAEARARDKPKG